MDELSKPAIALLPWGNLIEDFLDTIGVSFESFCNEMTGGWLFGYVEALKTTGVKTIIFCISGKATTTKYYTHLPTGAKICVLPAPAIYHHIRRPIINPYGWDIKEAIGNAKGLRRLQLAFYHHTLPYLATPLTLLAREIKKNNCLAILCQEYEYARFDVCVLLGKLLQIPVYASFQGGSFQLSRWERYLRPLTIKACQGLIIPSQAELERVKKKYNLEDEKLARIFNPLKFAAEKSPDRTMARKKLDLPINGQIVVWHGRVEIFRKGLDLLLDAWTRVTQQCRDRSLNLLLVGSGSGVKQLSKLIEQKKLSNVIWVDKYILDRQLIQTYLTAADLYVLPSRHEGFPVAPLEAMACGLPVVATNVSGIADILEFETKSGGLIVPPEDTIALSDAMIKILEDEHLRQQVGKSARQRVENNFSLAAVGEQLRAFLRISEN